MNDEYNIWNEVNSMKKKSIYGFVNGVNFLFIEARKCKIESIPQQTRLSRPVHKQRSRVEIDVKIRPNRIDGIRSTRLVYLSTRHWGSKPAQMHLHGGKRRLEPQHVSHRDGMRRLRSSPHLLLVSVRLLQVDLEQNVRASRVAARRQPVQIGLSFGRRSLPDSHLGAGRFGFGWPTNLFPARLYRVVCVRFCLLSMSVLSVFGCLVLWAH